MKYLSRPVSGRRRRAPGTSSRRSSSPGASPQSLRLLPWLILEVRDDTKHTNTQKHKRRVSGLSDVRELTRRSFTTTYPYRTFLSHIIRDDDVTLSSCRDLDQSDHLRLEKKRERAPASISLRSTDRLGSASLRFLASFFSSPDRRRASRE